MPPLSPDLVFQPSPDVPARGRLLLHGDHDRPEAVLQAAHRLGFTEAVADRAVLAALDGDRIRLAERPVAAVSLPDGLPTLLALSHRRPPAWPSWRPLPASVTVWSRLAAAALAVVASGRVAPSLHHVDGQVVGSWCALLAHAPASADAVERLAAALPPAGHALARGEGAVWAPVALAVTLVDAVADACVRLAAEPPRHDRPRARLLPWTQRWREALTDPTDASVPLREDEAGELVAGVAAWQQPARADDAHLALALHAPGDADPEPAWWLELGVRTAEGRRVPAAALWDQGPGASDEHDQEALAEALLRGLGQVARVFPPLDAALADAEPRACALTVDEAWRLIDEIAPLLTAADVELAVPDEIASRPRLRVRLDGGESDDAEAGEASDLSELLDGDAAAEVSLEVAVDAEPIADHELAGLLASDDPLVRWRGRWVPVDDEARRLLGAARPSSLPLRDALLWGLAGSAPLSAVADVPDHDDVAVDVVADGRIAGLLRRLEAARDGHAGDGPAATPPAEPEGFDGTLRGYQRRGVAWLGAMGELGVGGVLADDMGLGKTVQLIAHLLRVGADGPHLVVCPTSVVGNWERELGRFSPGVPVTRFHGPDRPRDLSDVAGVVVTSYGTLRRDADPLVAVPWRIVTLDEAQHVKNPGTAGARAVRRLDAQQTLALTGTPLENRLTELWTLLDATNPGLLGSRARFGRRFVGPIERRGDAAAAERLRRLVAPFVLRRRKDDPEIVGDLPDKLERTVVAALTAEQAQRYQDAVDRVLGDGLAAASAMERRGRVLALLTELKQICNHPAHHTGEDDPVLPGRSGKLAAAREIVADAVDAGEAVLVFTQFVAMGRLLVRQLADDLDTDVPLLHGGVAARARDRMVEQFQGGTAPVMVVSLRAGGTGLNLTAATQVLHYDRWWNPAVEDQATDRTHRIGQTHRVMVHKLVTAGTVEERVAALLERKRSLAESVVGAGEEWLTELDDDALAELVALSAPGEELDDDGWAPWAEAS